ncbi:MAG: hypothetical protein NTV34_18300, partial [Proteobacteria bacterium]|nr:hypothetical protein [Pseudomonadota bacterium]
LCLDCLKLSNLIIALMVSTPFFLTGFLTFFLIIPLNRVGALSTKSACFMADLSLSPPSLIFALSEE